MSMNKAVVTQSGNIRTPRGRILYPALFQPRAAKGAPADSAKYQCSLLIPKGSDISAMKSAVEAILKENFSEKVRSTVKIKTPFLRTEDQPRFAEFADDFPLMIRCNSTYRPDVVGPTMQPIREEDEADEVYGGRWGRLSVNPFAYNRPDSKGVSLGLQNVQLLDHADPIAGGRVKAENDFEAVGDALGELDDEVV